VPQVLLTTRNPTPKLPSPQKITMDSRLPRTPVNAQAGTSQTRTNSEENTPQSRKRSRRRYEPQEGRGVAYKRGRVCQSCRAKKIKVSCANTVKPSQLLILISASTSSFHSKSSKMKSPPPRLQESQAEERIPPLTSPTRTGAYIKIMGAR
jgi:hypothetical protein